LDIVSPCFDSAAASIEACKLEVTGEVFFSHFLDVISIVIQVLLRNSEVNQVYCGWIFVTNQNIVEF
jgi:hypothetical protein